ncbi:hypothetical protein [Mycobacterium lepromatosis]|uniref:hypothetical protein n=1 Tax=Mycobacterium lepromatosis TaxID=480418 RepID=UPI000ADFB29C|nr:hypothetical protein [Mycobacterium lepromatosis]
MQSAKNTGDLDDQTDALLALLDADYVEHLWQSRPGNVGPGVGESGAKLCGQ